MYKHITLLSILLLLFIISLAVGQDLPPAPTNLIVEQKANEAKLQWDEVTEAQGYRVYKAVDTLHFVRIAQIRMNHYSDQCIPANHVYSYYVTAFNSNGESLPSNDVSFTPTDVKPPRRARGVIEGTILDDSTGLPIGGVRLRFFTTNGLLYFREDRSDSLGYYSMHIDTGSYLVYASKWHYIPEWYDNSLKREYATPVHIAMGDTITANFALTRIPSPPHMRGTVSGMVTDEATGQPIEGAYVVMMRSNREIKMMQNYEGALFGHREETFVVPGFGRSVGVIRVTKTDAEGKYTLKAPLGISYIMLSIKPGYIGEFFKEKTNPFDADRILLRGDTNGIDFTLKINPDVQNSLAGTVKNEEGFGVMSKVILFSKSKHAVQSIRCTITDSLGYYSFKYLYADHYYAKAVPFQEYAPAWYSNDSCGVICWTHADSFYVEGNTTGIDICVKPITFGGFASIGGTVREENTSALVHGITVYAVDPSTNTIVSYDITEDDGTFDITDIAPGDYKIVVDKEGYTANQEQMFSVDADNNYTMNDVEVNVGNLTLSSNDNDTPVPSGYILEQNYPNPFNPSTEIVFGLPTASRVKITVFTLLGQHVATIAAGEFSSGTYSIPWDGKDFSGKAVASGIYFYKLTADALNNTSHFSQVRKMVLTK
jgi:hypothetical protein